MRMSVIKAIALTVLGTSAAIADDAPRIAVVCEGTGLAEILGTHTYMLPLGYSADMGIAVGVYRFAVTYSENPARIKIMRIDLTNASETYAVGAAHQPVILSVDDPEKHPLTISCRLANQKSQESARSAK